MKNPKYILKWGLIGHVIIDREDQGPSFSFKPNPGFLFWRQRDSKKGSAYAFFWGGLVPITFSFFKLFLSPGDFSGGIFGV